MRRRAFRKVVLTVLALTGCARPDENAEAPDPARENARQEKIAAARDNAFAASCAATLAPRDPAADARTAAGVGDRRLLTWEEGSVALVHVAPGVDDCEPIGTRNVAPLGLPDLPLGHAPQGCVLTESDTRLFPCYSANRAYGEAFNREMLRIAPESRQASCKSPEYLKAERAVGTGRWPTASPARNLSELLRPDDYPAGAILAQEEGISRVRLLVEPTGHVRRCETTRFSGSDALDGVTCTLLQARARFGSATGGPWAGFRTIPARIHWTLPAELRRPDALAKGPTGDYARRELKALVQAREEAARSGRAMPRPGEPPVAIPAPPPPPPPHPATHETFGGADRITESR